MGPQAAMEVPLIPGPEVDSIRAIIERTGYQLEVTVGQRKYHRPPGFTDINPVTGEPTNVGCVCPHYTKQHYNGMVLME